MSASTRRAFTLPRQLCKWFWVLCPRGAISYGSAGYTVPWPHFQSCLTSVSKDLRDSEGFPGGSGVKNPPANAGDMGLIPGSGRSPGKGNGNPVQYSCLENSMGRGAWWDVVHAMAKSWTWLCDYLSLFFCFRLKNIFNETRDSIKIMLICTLKSLASLILLQS